ncbi:MAG: ABC transporter ATP-binding protein [Leptospiraceae bacterium]|nr:ABC transporter ATP-binding protein [Leptospiraceae bacterium]
MGAIRRILQSVQLSGRTIQLVWQAGKSIVIALVVLTAVAGVAPALATYISKLVVDGVVGVLNQEDITHAHVMWLVAVEAVLIIMVAGSQRGLTTAGSMMQQLLAYEINIKILLKALQLDLTQFEDPEINDSLERARREAGNRPLSLLNRILIMSRYGILLAGYGYLLLAFSPLALLVLFVSGMPAFIAELWFSEKTYKHRSGREVEMRRMTYLQMIMTRDRYAQELRLFQLGSKFLQQFKTIFQSIFQQDRSLIYQRGFWGVLLQILSSATFYGAYAWIVYATMNPNGPSLGEMTMYLVIFRQGQNAITSSLSALGGLYEDNLYMSNLFSFLDTPVPESTGTAVRGTRPGDGIRYENVYYTYPGRSQSALKNINLHIGPGEKFALIGANGSGKTTLIKLLTRLIEPDRGRILLDGVDVREWNVDALYRRIGVIFQIFNRYKISVGENIGAGDVLEFSNQKLRERAAKLSFADEFIKKLPYKYDTVLGRNFPGGQELSGGQWQRIALARAFMRRSADILILDEPTASVDAEVEAKVFEHLREHTGQTVVIITHRFATIRHADHIVLLKDGRVLEEGNHNQLFRKQGEYRRLFQLQARGYKEKGRR